MHGNVIAILYLLLSFCMISGIALCTHGSYLNLCGYCVGGTTDKSDLEGLDRCGICNGQSDCVGCDGIINSPRRRDTCGMCLPPDAKQWNDCRKIAGLFPSVLDVSIDSSLLPLTIIGAGLAESDMNTTHCHILPLESQFETPIVREISLEDNEIQVKVFLGNSTGRYKIGCSEIEDFAEVRIVDSRRINVINVNPSEVSVDDTVELEVEVGEDNSGNTNGTYWCYVRMKVGEVQTLRAIRKTGKIFKCSKYKVTTPGILKVGIVAREDAAVGENSTGRAADLHSRAKPPVPVAAAYSPDLQNIVITFDQNIKVVDCNKTFSPETEKFLGKGFTCFAFANNLYVTPGDDSQISHSLTFTDNNSIRRAGSSETELSPTTKAITLSVSRKNVMEPKFTISSPNVICADKTKQPVINVKVSGLGKQSLNYTWVVPPSRESKRSQRENILLWKHGRSVEKILNNAPNTGVFALNRTILHSGFNYVLNLKSSIAFGKPSRLTAALTMPQEGNISLTVTTFPSSSVIAAEARVVFCADNDRPVLRYIWKVSDEVVSEDGKLLFITQNTPGIYNVSCTLYNQNTNQILGTGWSLTEVVNLPEPVTIFPTNVVVGTMDEIVLQAHSSEPRLRWSCVTSRGEPCITVGRKANPVENIVDVTSPMLRIPSGTLPVGSYVWTLNGLNTATAAVTVAANIPPMLRVLPSQSKVDLTSPLLLNAEAERLKPGCRIRWKTIRKNGFNYFDLHEDVGLGDLVEVQVDDPLMGEREVPLVVPPARGKWKGLTGGATYLLRLESICPEPIPAAYVDIPVTVNAPPIGMNFQMTPETGQAINTKFSITISEGTDTVEDYPLIYKVSYRDELDEVQMGATAMTDFMINLPPGNITVTIMNCDIWNSCSISSKLVRIEQTSEVTPEAIKNLSQEIKNDMLSGDTIAAYGKAITAFKSLSQRQEDKGKLDELLSVAESAIRERLSSLAERFLSDPKLMKPSFEFLEQSVTNLKFFPDAKKLVNVLTEFKNLITKRPTLSRVRREAEGRSSSNHKETATDKILVRRNRDTADIKMNENTIKAIFDLHGKILEQNDTDNNKEEFLKDVRKYMIESCGIILDSTQSPIIIESSIVTLQVMKLTQNLIKKDLQITREPNAKIRFILKSIPRKTCAAIAKYRKYFVGLTNTSWVSDVFEVRLIKNGTFKDSFKDDIKSLVLTLPLHMNDSHEAADCMSWSESGGWKSACTLKEKTNVTITCDCRDSGIVSAVMTKQPIKASTNPMPFTGATLTLSNNTVAPTLATSGVMSNSTISTTKTSNITTPTTISTINFTTQTTAATTTTINTILTNFTKRNNISLTTTTQNSTTAESKITSPTSKTTTDKVIPNLVEDVSDVRGNTTPVYMSGTFLIEEDYRATVGKNETEFKNIIKKQLAQQLSIKENAIANLIISPGSILITVLFIDTEEAKAEAAIKELNDKLHDGSLQLVGQNATVLRVPRQHLRIKVGTTLTRNTGKVRIITYGIVAGTIVIIFLFAIGATYFKRKRARIPLRLPRLSIDDHPMYRQFHNEFSLDGSMATLERYRRDHPFETETM